MDNTNTSLSKFYEEFCYYYDHRDQYNCLTTAEVLDATAQILGKLFEAGKLDD